MTAADEPLSERDRAVLRIIRTLDDTCPCGATVLGGSEWVVALQRASGLWKMRHSRHTEVAA